MNFKCISLITLLLLLITSSYAQRHGLVIDSTNTPGSNGVQIRHADNHGILVNSAGRAGVIVFKAETGINIQDPEDYGIYINAAGQDGIRIWNADRDGLFIRQTGGFSINIQGEKSTTGFHGHVAQIYNRSNGSSPDVLALRVGTTSDPSGGSNYITFYYNNASGDPVSNGRIEGNGNGGVLYGTSGADFAEALPRRSTLDNIEGGDIIGVKDGVISHNTTNAIQVMAITDRPAVLGNQGDEGKTIHEMVSFIGQIPIKVLGPVKQGDWIVPSGLHDGIGRAISSSDLTLEHRIVGRAWESSPDAEVKKVNCAVGLDQSEAKDEILKNMHEHMLEMQLQIDQLLKRN